MLILLILAQSVQKLAYRTVNKTSNRAARKGMRVLDSLLAMTAAASSALQARCHCGHVGVRIINDAVPQARSICHCSSCRTLSGAPFLANLVFAAEDVEITAGEDGTETPSLLITQTSKHVTRKRCAKCYSPVIATLGPKRVVVPYALFERTALPASWAPEHHLHYDRRVIDIQDALPKYRANFGSELWGPSAEANGR